MPSRSAHIRVPFGAPATTHVSRHVPLGHSLAALFSLPWRETFFCFDLLFFLYRPPNATGPVLCVLINMLSMHFRCPLLLPVLFYGWAAPRLSTLASSRREVVS